VRRYVRLWRQNQPKEMFLPMDFGIERGPSPAIPTTCHCSSKNPTMCCIPCLSGSLSYRLLWNNSSNQLAARSSQPPQDIVDLLELMDQQGVEAVAAAAGQALLMGTVSVTALRALLPPPAEVKVQISALLLSG